MPFLKRLGQPFTQRVIETLAPNQLGVYGLYRGNVWVYVGSGNIRDRLLAHLRGDNPRITAAQPTHWIDEVTAIMVGREKQLILELNPTANQRLG